MLWNHSSKGHSAILSAKPLRIAHVTATFPPYRGGTGTVCYYNALGLARSGHEVHIFTDKRSPVPADTDPPELTVHRLPVVFRIGNAPLLPSLLSLGKFDVVHLHYPFVFGQEMIWLNRLFRRQRYVITYHQDLILTGAINSGVTLHHRLLGKQILLGAQRLMATSLDYAHASRLAEIAPKLGSRLGELPNGIDDSRFTPNCDAQALRAHYGIGADDPVILFVGGLDRAHYFKGVEVLLQAFQRVHADHPRAWLFLIGDGDLRPMYEELAGTLVNHEHVIFGGHIGEDELPRHYAMSDWLVLPSTTMGEAFGVVILEAMASGKPAIASRLPGVQTVVEDGVDGYLVTPGDVDDLAQKLRLMLDDPQQRREMGMRGRAKIEARYAWRRIIPRLIETYQAVMDETSRPSA